MKRWGITLLGLALAALAAPLAAQERARVNWVTLHSAALEGNLEGNSPERGAYVVTPPGYDENAGQRYPVVYFLHGYWATPKMYEELLDLGTAVSEAAAAGNAMIVVMPDGHSKQGGGFYANSPTAGNYEGFVGEDLVGFVDSHYRTLAQRASRGLAGHSMGGYGTLRVGMKYPQVFSSLYAMSACCMTPRALTPEDARKVDALTQEQQAALPFAEKGLLATLSAFSPDAGHSPNYWNSGLQTDGTIDPLVRDRLAANAILAMLPQYLPSYRAMAAIAIDVGDKDRLLDGNKALDEALTNFGIAHGFMVYDGEHGDKIAARFRSHVLPFFAEHLDREGTD